MNVRLLIAFFSIGVILAAVSSAEAQKREMPYKEAEKIISASRRMGYDVATVRTWIRDDGLTIRRVSENTLVGKPHITKGGWEFEYENIEIKAPIK